MTSAVRVARVVLGLVVAATLVDAGRAPASAQTASLGGYQGRAAASGIHVLYAPEGLLPTSPPGDLGIPDALATIASGPVTFARAAVADPGDLLANPDALLALADSSWEPGTIPPYPYRVTASSGVGEPEAASSPAPGLHARVEVDSSSSWAQSTTPAMDAPAIATIGSMSSTATTSTDGSTVTVRSQAEISGVDILGLVTIDSVVTDLTATSDGTDTSIDGGTIVTGASVLGQPVTIDADGVHLAGDPSAPPDPLLGGVIGPLVGGVNDLLAGAGIRITVAGPVELDGGTGGELASAGLRIDLDLSPETIPGLADLLDALPPLENPAPGAPSIEDLLVAAEARHIAAVQLGPGVVSLDARPAVSFTPPARPPASSTPPPAPTRTGALPSSRVASPNPAATDTATPSATSPALAEGAPATSLGTGIGALALLALLTQPVLGDRIARASAALLAAGTGDSCPREQR